MNVAGRAQSWREMLVLQSLAFLATGLSLIWGPDGARLGLVNRAGRPQWNLLLSPVLTVLVILLDHANGALPVIAVAPTLVITLTADRAGRPG